MDERTEDNRSYAVVYMINSLIPKHDFAWLLLDRLNDNVPNSEGAFPHNPIQQAYGFWKRVNEKGYYFIHPEWFDDEEDLRHFVRTRLQWKNEFIDYIWADDEEGDHDSQSEASHAPSRRPSDCTRYQSTAPIQFPMNDELCRLRAYQSMGYDERKFISEEWTSLLFAEYISTCSITQVSDDGLIREYLRPLSIEHVTDIGDTESYTLHFKRVPDPIHRSNYLTLLSHGKRPDRFLCLHFGHADADAHSWIHSDMVSPRIPFDYNHEQQELTITIPHPDVVISRTPMKQSVDVHSMLQ